MFDGYEFTSKSLHCLALKTVPYRLLWCAVSAHVRLPPRGRRSRAQAPPRTTGQPGRETRRGKEHVGKAEWPEGM